MKNIFKFFGAFLTVLFAAALTGCTFEEELGSSDVGLHIKVFFPTKVVAGQPMTINGSGFSDVKEIVFPGDVKVTDFTVVTNDMIRVVAPSGIASEGGNIVVRTESGEEAVSPMVLTLGGTVISGYSVYEGDEVEGGTAITIYGTDLDFVSRIEIKDEEGNPLFIEDASFTRKVTSSVIFTLPKKLFEGTYAGKVYTIDGKVFDMPELTYKSASDGGYWETVEKVIWENDGSIGEGSWGNTYRFALEGKNGGDASVELPADLWGLLKSGPFSMTVQPVADWWQIRVLTGYWQGQWPSDDSSGNGDINVNWTDIVADNGDGTFTVTIDFTGHGILDLMDEQNLLFAGQGFQILKIFTSEEIWVEGGSTTEIVKTSVWVNDGSVGEGNWGNNYRFAGEGTYSAEAVAVIAADHWAKMKADPFKVLVKSVADQWQIRVITGYWGAQWPKANVNDGEFDLKPETVLLSEYPDIVVDNGDGTYIINMNFAGHEIATLIDEQNLLFAGQGFQILEIYFEEEVVVSGGGGSSGPVETVLWEGEAIADGWTNQPYGLSDGGAELSAANAQPGQIINFYAAPISDDKPWYLELVEGHWSGVTYLTVCAVGGDTQNGKFTEYDLAANNGIIPLTITQEMLDAAYTPGGWGGVFVLNGDNFKCTKISIVQ